MKLQKCSVLAQAGGASSPACPAMRRRRFAATGVPALAVAGQSSAGGSSGKPGAGLGGSVPTQHSFARRQQVPPTHTSGSGGGGSCSVTTTTTRGAVLYSAALNFARNEQFERARRVFEATVSECPCYVKAWVSWAQMEKRSIPRGDDTRWAACRSVLQRGLVCNPDAPALLQAWGLMEMQRGNWVAAVLLLDRSARLEPRNTPVLRWKPVIEARKTVGSRGRRSAGRGGAGGPGSSGTS